jgi:hypothetical protein
MRKKGFFARLSALLLCFLIAFTFAACAGNTEPLPAGGGGEGGGDDTANPNVPVPDSNAVRISQNEFIGVSTANGTAGGDELEDDDFLTGAKQYPASYTDAPWGVQGSAKYTVRNVGDLWYGVWISVPNKDDPTILEMFQRGKSYLLVFDFKMIREGDYDSGFVWMQLDKENSRKAPIPAAGEWSTISVVFDRVEGEYDHINLFAMECDIDFAIGNIRILELAGGSRDKNVHPTKTFIDYDYTLNGEASAVEKLIGREQANNHYGKGIMSGGGLVFGGGGRDDGDNYPGVDGTFKQALEPGDYSVKLDFTLLMIYDGTDFCIKIGSHTEAVDVSEFKYFEKHALEFDIEIGNPGAAVFALYLDAEYDAAENPVSITFIMSNLVITKK